MQIRCGGTHPISSNSYSSFSAHLLIFSGPSNSDPMVGGSSLTYVRRSVASRSHTYSWPIQCLQGRVRVLGGSDPDCVMSVNEMEQIYEEPKMYLWQEHEHIVVKVE